MGQQPLLIRLARGDELDALCDVEVQADGLFALVGLAGVLSSPAPQADSLRDAVAGGRLFVVVDAHDRAVGFVRIELLDGQAHVEQVSVHPAHAGRRIGAQLLAAAAEWAVAQGRERLTLTTYRDVPWNGPYYERLGWVVLSAEQLGPGLAAARARERLLGLDAAPRQAMVLFWVYASSLRYADLALVTMGWVVMLRVGLVLIDRQRYGVELPAGKWVAIGVVLAAQT